MLHIDVCDLKDFVKNNYYLQRTNGRPLSNTLHTHTFYEFLYVVSGLCDHERNGKKENLSSGDLVFLSPEVSHRFLSQSNDADVIALSVAAHEVENILKDFGLSSFFTSSSSFILLPEERMLLLKLYKSVIDDDSNDHIIHLRILSNQIILFCLESALIKTHFPTNFEKLCKTMQNLELAVEGIPAMLRLSQYSHSQLCRLSKEYLGMTPTEYVNSIRMKYALNLVLYSDTEYEEISETVGFESFSYFCKLFKKSFGCSVAKMRKETKNIRKTV